MFFAGWESGGLLLHGVGSLTRRIVRVLSSAEEQGLCFVRVFAAVGERCTDNIFSGRSLPAA